MPRQHQAGRIGRHFQAGLAERRRHRAVDVTPGFLLLDGQRVELGVKALLAELLPIIEIGRPRDRPLADHLNDVILQRAGGQRYPGAGQLVEKRYSVIGVEHQ
ncbi:MAG: hypothetical protein E5X07_25440 [Mesorhizobium sp.]|nr:MAG: hypothetical protein E5X07_25440 [Mesorhizobium sp.]